MMNHTASAATAVRMTMGALSRADKALGRGDYRSAILALDEASTEIPLRMVVRAWRGTGATWQEIGDLLGITRQAAWARFSSTATQ